MTHPHHMLRRTFLAIAAAIFSSPIVARALPAVGPRVGDEVPPVEAAWRALPPGAVVECVREAAPRDYDARWILVHRNGPRLVGSYRLAWGGAHAGAAPWREIERRGVMRHVVIAVGVPDDDRAVADAVDPRCTDVEREWVVDVWRRLWEPQRPPLTAEQVERCRQVMRDLVLGHLGRA